MEDKIKEIIKKGETYFQIRDSLCKLNITEKEWYNLPIKAKFSYITHTLCVDCEYNFCGKNIKDINTFKIDENGFVKLICEDFKWW